MGTAVDQCRPYTFSPLQNPLSLSVAVGEGVVCCFWASETRFNFSKSGVFDGVVGNHVGTYLGVGLEPTLQNTRDKHPYYGYSQHIAYSYRRG